MIAAFLSGLVILELNPLKELLMKKLVTILSTLSFSVTVVAGSKPAPSTVSVKGLSSCEQDIVASMSENQRLAWRAGVSAVAGGVLAGGITFGAGFMSESSGSSSEIAMNATPTEPGSASLIISAVGTGVVVAALFLGAGYYDYRNTVDGQESLLQLFKEVRNNGMGPQIDLRVSVLQKTLKKLKSKSAKRFWETTRQEFNEAGMTDAAVRAAMMQAVGEFGASNVVECDVAAEVSQRIDKRALQIVIEKFNPSLRAVLK